MKTTTASFLALLVTVQAQAPAPSHALTEAQPYIENQATRVSGSLPSQKFFAVENDSARRPTDSTRSWTA